MSLLLSSTCQFVAGAGALSGEGAAAVAGCPSRPPYVTLLHDSEVMKMNNYVVTYRNK